MSTVTLIPHEHRKEDIFDSILLAFLGALSVLFVLPGFSLQDKAIQVHYNELLPVQVLVSAYVLFLSLTYFLMTSRRKVTGKGIPPLILFLYFGFLLLRLISLFSFPYGEVSYSLFLKDVTGTFTYEGFSLPLRFLNFFNDAFLGFFYVLFFSYVRTFSEDIVKKETRGLSYFLISLVLVMIAYSLLKEKDIWNNNFSVLFLGKEARLDLSLRSFTSYRNVFGFFLMLSNLLSIAEMFRKPNLFFFFNLPLTLFSLLIIFSRTPLLLITISDLVFAFLFVITMIQKHRKEAIAVLIVSLAAILLLIFLFLFNPSVAKFWKEAITNNHTVEARGVHVKYTDALLHSYPYYFFFGYNLVPYRSVLLEAKTYAIPFEQLPYSHLVYLDMVGQWGVFALLLVIAIYFFFLTGVISDLVRYQKVTTLGYFIFFVTSLLYGFLEPRGILMDESSSILYTIFLLYPLLFDLRGNQDHLEETMDDHLHHALEKIPFRKKKPL
ncbi:MAG: hypothetical protein PUA93_06265 [Eubacteriales bacterium]|nr:hypothetical protein [Eubacteriales bacterium]